MRSDQEMFDLILNYARNDERIRAVMLNGSRVNPNAPKDPFQDFDVVYFVREVAPFARNPAVVDYFGEIMILQTPEDMEGSDNDGHYGYLMQFMDGTRIDLSFYVLEEISRLTADSLSQILLDKDGIMPELPPANDSGYLPQPPTEKQFNECCNEFWWVSPYVAKGLWRSELTNAGYFMDSIRHQLMEMLTWTFGVRSGFQKAAGKAGKYLKSGLTAEEWTLLERTYADAVPDHNWNALLAMGELFRQSGRLVAGHYGFTYPEREDHDVTTFLKRIRRLPRDAQEIFDAAAREDEISLREVEDADFEIFFEQQRDPEGQHMAAFTPKESNDHDAYLARLARIRANVSVIQRTILYQGKVAGSILSHCAFGEPEVSYWIGRPFWGKGIASLALARFLEIQTARPLTGRVVKDNVASRRVLEKNGFVACGEDRGFANARSEEVEEIILVLKSGEENKMSNQNLISNAFQSFMSEAPQHAQAWGGMVQGLGAASALDKKTSALAYLAVLAALRLESGIPFHVKSAKQSGATREEVISAILVGLPAAGHVVTQVLPSAVAAYDEE